MNTNYDAGDIGIMMGFHPNMRIVGFRLWVTVTFCDSFYSGIITLILRFVYLTRSQKEPTPAQAFTYKQWFLHTPVRPMQATASAQFLYATALQTTLCTPREKRTTSTCSVLALQRA